MADGDLDWIATCNDADVIAALKRCARETENYKQQIRELSQETLKAEKYTKTWLDTGLANATRMAAGFLSVQTALNLVNKEYQAWLDKQKNSANATTSTADAQIKFYRNLGRVTPEERDRLNQQIKGIAAETSQSAATIYGTATQAISSQGNLTREQMLENVRVAAKLVPEKGAEAEQAAMAGVLGDVASLTGSGNAMENAGLMLGIGEQAHIPNMRQVGKNLIPAAIGVKQTLKGTSAADALALVSTLTMVSKDNEGALSGTAGVALAAQLDSFFGADAKVTKRDTEGALLKKLGDGTLIEQMDKLADPKARDAFFAKASFEAKSEPFLKELLTPGSPARQLFDKNRTKVPSGQAAIDQSEEYLNNLLNTPEQRLAALQRTYQAKTDELQIDDQLGANTSVTREGLDTVLAASGQGYLSRSVQARFYDAVSLGLNGGDTKGTAIEHLQSRADYLRGVDPETREGAVAANPRDEAIAKKLDDMIVELRGIRTDPKQQQPTKKNIDRNTE